MCAHGLAYNIMLSRLTGQVIEAIQSCILNTQKYFMGVQLVYVHLYKFSS